jgi:hypothetical protein
MNLFEKNRIRKLAGLPVMFESMAGESAVNSKEELAKLLQQSTVVWSEPYGPNGDSHLVIISDLPPNVSKDELHRKLAANMSPKAALEMKDEHHDTINDPVTMYMDNNDSWFNFPLKVETASFRDWNARINKYYNGILQYHKDLVDQDTRDGTDHAKAFVDRTA